MLNEGYIGDSENSIKFYRTILGRMFNAFALHKIILDDEGKPSDYEFIDVNPSFEIFTGLKKEDIIGKPISEIIPGIREDSVDWIDIYGNAATKGDSMN